MASIYPQEQLAEVLLPIVDKFKASYGFAHWNAGSLLEADTFDTVIRLDNSSRLNLGADEKFESVELRFPRLEVSGKTAPELDNAVRDKLEHAAWAKSSEITTR